MRIFKEEDIKQLTIVPKINDANYFSTVYKKDNRYYKIWRFHNPGFYTMEGLNIIWQGCHTISSISVGLINSETCPAFIETLHNEVGDCIGYCLEEGKKIESLDPRYPKFIERLVDISIEKGYGIDDCNVKNIVDIRGKLSIIDINFPPIKLNHAVNFSSSELDFWYDCFGSKSEYFNLLRTKYLAPFYESKTACIK